MIFLATSRDVFTVALSHLLDRGVLLRADEAVAIAQTLIATSPGRPSPENVEVRSDGSVSCISASGPRSVEAIATLLSVLLPLTTKVPAALRYAIARGMGDVEAPPFDSLDAFSTTLVRFESGDRSAVVRALLARVAESARPAVAPPPPSPKRPTAAVIRSNPAAEARIRETPTDEASPAAEARIAKTLAVRSALMSQAVTPRAPRVAMALAVALALIVSGYAGFRFAPHGWTRVPSRAGQTSAPTDAALVRPDDTVSEPSIATTGREPKVPAVAATTGRLREAVARTEVRAPRPIDALRAWRAPAFSPAFSADGTAIFFHTGRPGDASSAIAMARGADPLDDDRGIRTIVDDGSRNYHPQPSPDGLLIAFDSDRDGARGVYVANRDGSNVRRVSGSGYAAVPTWAPDSRNLAYIRADGHRAGVWNLWIKPQSGPEWPLTHYTFGQTWGAAWFPDARRICYTHEDALIVMDLTTGRSRQFASPVRGSLVRTPAVSPDGSRIVFQVRHHGTWMLNTADGSMQFVLADPSAEEFAWAPDGGRIAFHSRRAGRWTIYEIRGT